MPSKGKHWNVLCQNRCQSRCSDTTFFVLLKNPSSRETTPFHTVVVVVVAFSSTEYFKVSLKFLAIMVGEMYYWD